MSYTIEYNRKCFRLDAGTVIGDARPLFEATYFLFIQQGDNNVRPRPRTWCMESVGSHDTVLKDVCERAGACAGGDLQLSSGRTTPELYITRYRRVLSRAAPLTLEVLHADLGIHALLYTFLEPAMLGRLDEFHRGRLAEVEARFEKQLVSGRYLEYRIAPRTLGDFMLWANNRSLAASLRGITAIDSRLNR